MFGLDKLKELFPKKKTQEELDEHYENAPELEKGDFLAMVIAAFLTFFPVLIGAMLLFFGLLWLLFLR